MPVELRKRKAPPPPPPPPAKKARATKAATTKATKSKAPAKEKAPPAAASTNGTATAAAKLSVGDTIDLEGFGGEIETNDGTKTTLKALVDESKAGVALFTYPKASTPGCTKQACLFRDGYSTLSVASGLAIYGLSTDSPKANTSFQTKHNLPFPLLCDPAATLIAAIGLKKSPRGTQRGVFVVDKSGKVLAAEGGGPDATVAVVKGVVEGLAGGEGEKGEEKGEEAKEANGEEKAANGVANGEEKGEEEKEEEKEDKKE